MATGLCTIVKDAGYSANRFDGLIGRFEKLPPQLGQTSLRTSVTQLWQKVHSKVHIMASSASKGSGLLQCSHVGRNSIIWQVLCNRVT